VTHDATWNGRSGLRGLVLALSILALTACATRPPASDRAAVAAYEETNDQLEPLNR